MATKPAAGAGRDLIPSSRSRKALAKRLAAQAGRMSSAVIAEMETQHPWYAELGAEDRSWVTMVANSGINGFVEWLADEDDGTKRLVLGREGGTEQRADRVPALDIAGIRMYIVDDLGPGAGQDSAHHTAAGAPAVCTGGFLPVEERLFPLNRDAETFAGIPMGPARAP